MLKTLLENRGYKHITFDDFSLVQLFKEDPEKIKSPEDYGFLVYRGENKPFTNNITIINYKEFLENFIYTF